MRRFLTIIAAVGGLLCACAAQAGEARLPTVYILSTGGTIAGRGSSETDLSNYKAGQITGQDLLDAVPQIRQIAQTKVEQIVNVASNDITLDNWLTLANRINHIFENDADAAGVVVTHGTSSLEETAYFLNLTIKHDQPVILVGAMRPATAISADGPLNLLNAVRVAISPEAKGKGALIVMNDEINSARDATKTNTYRVETFRAPELGYLGYVDEDKISFIRASTKRHTSKSEFDVGGIRDLPKVDILYSYVDSDARLIEALILTGTKGIVFAGMGAGGLSRSQSQLLDKMAQENADAPVFVSSSRVGNGRVIGNDNQNRRHLIPADTLNPQKARILLMLALTKTKDPSEIRRMFSEY